MMMNTNTKDREIRLSREFEASRELVFDAFTAPEKIGQWWGPDGFTTTTGEMNFEVGGDWIFTMHDPEGTDYPNHIVYTEIKEPERITYDHYGDQDKKDDSPHFKTTIVFEDLGKRTKINMNMRFPTVQKRKEATEFGAVEGGRQTLGRLADYLEDK